MTRHGLEEMGDQMTSDTMDIPMIKRVAKAFHGKHYTSKRKGKQEQEVVRPELYEVKGGRAMGDMQDYGKNRGRAVVGGPQDGKGSEGAAERNDCHLT